MVGTMKAVARRPTPAAQPNPDARALVGNTSDAKICIELPATWMKKIITKPATSNCMSDAALANTIAIRPAQMNAHTDVILRPNIMTSKGFTITKSLTYTFGMTLAVPCASLFMMYALDKFGRKITSVCAFICAGLMAIVFANAASDMQLLVAGFVMIFFIQVAGNSMQIFASEVFPTNARASGFGWAAGVGRLATAFIVPTILWVQTGYGLTTVFVCLAIVLVIAAGAVTQLPGSQAKGPRRNRPADGLIRVRCKAAGTGSARCR